MGGEQGFCQAEGALGLPAQQQGADRLGLAPQAIAAVSDYADAVDRADHQALGVDAVGQG
ncbi:hypothetical protein D3C77_817270 [compost metagenome]